MTPTLLAKRLQKIFVGVLLFTGMIPAFPVEFTNVASIWLDGPVRVADWNSDGFVDLFSQPELRPYWNTGTNFNAGNAPTNFWESEYFPVVLGDFDSSGDLDLYAVPRPTFAALPLKGTIRWNGGADIGSNGPESFFHATLNGTAAAGDFDNDGDLDLIVTGVTLDFQAITPPSGSATRLYENVGGGLFVVYPQNFPQFDRGFSAWADYDSDGDLDLLLSGYRGSQLSTILYRNDDGRFVDSGHKFSVAGAAVPLNQNAIFADFDNDGDLDLILGGTGLGTAGPVILYRNELTNFVAVTLNVSLSETPDIHAADFDNDGFLDIATQFITSTCQVFLNNRAGGFFPPETVSGVFRGQILLADVDGDSRVDLLHSRDDLPLRIYKNLGTKSNSDPSVPAALSSFVSNNSVRLDWSASADAEQNNGLTYNLRIGTAPGKCDVMSAMANTITDQRLIFAPGNTGLRTNWTIHRLPAGTYFWSVQAIDHNFRASRFSQEQSFTISTGPPILQTFGVTNITSATAIIACEVHALRVPTDVYAEVITTNGILHTAPTAVADPSLSQHLLIALKDLSPEVGYTARLVASNQFGITYGPLVNFTTAPFSSVTELHVSVPYFRDPPRIIRVDYDQDADMDLLAVPRSPVRVIKLRNESGVFAEAGYLDYPTLLTGSFPKYGDINNDAHLDYVPSQTSLIVYQGSEPFITTNASSGTLTGNPLLVDFDNDGDLDLIARRSQNPYELSRFTNNGLPSLVGSRWNTPGQFARSGDYDDDGDMDLLVWGRTNSASFVSVVQVIQNHMAGEPVEPAVLHESEYADWADFDNDGDLDILTVLKTNSIPPFSYLDLLWNGAENGFSSLTLLSAQSLLAVYPTDFDRDGYMDIFAHDNSSDGSKLRFLRNIGNGQFEEIDLGLPVVTAFSCAIGDFDSDKMPDVMLAAFTHPFSGYHLRLFRNNLTASTSLPPTPINLTATVAKTSSMVSWELPGETKGVRRHSYSFNLRIGKTPGGSEIMSAQSDPITGARYVPQRGNAGQSGSWTIRDLPPGTYYWSVQSVDHAFNGSPFSTEETFAIASYERPPKILSIERHGDSHYYVTLDAETRSLVQLQGSSDLVDWIQVVGEVYIGSEPAVVDLGTALGEHRFYRFVLLE